MTDKVKSIPDSPVQPTIEKKTSMSYKAKKPAGKLTKQVMRVQFDITYNGSPGKKMDPNGKTMPDMNMSITQLLINHQAGVESGKTSQKVPLYFDMEVPTITDITDIEIYRENLEQQLQHTKDFLEKEKEDKKAQIIKDKEAKKRSDAQIVASGKRIQAQQEFDKEHGTTDN